MSKLEYLNPEDWSLHVIDGENEAVSESWVLVPEGAIKLLHSSVNRGHYHFVSLSNELMALYDIKNGDGYWYGNASEYKKSVCATVIWQRESKSVVVEDVVNSPSHYAKGGVECIDAIESSMTKEAFCGYLKGNVQKYMWRYENKGGIESLKKAQWYLNKLIEIEGK